MDNEKKVKIARQFYKEVCAEAERKMEQTGTLEGSHFAAMQIVLKRWEEKR